jgi:hypothetical protein
MRQAERNRPWRAVARLIASTMALGVLATTAPAGAGAGPAPDADNERVEEAHGISAGGGLQFLSPEDRDRTLDDMVDLGVSWVRFDLNWADVQSDGRGSFDWARYDALVEAVVQRGLEPLVIIAYTPRWARPGSCLDDDKCAPARVRDYSRFVSKSVKRYGDRGVKHWEIWNEPNLVNFWKPAPDPERYAELLIRATAAIKRIDKEAVVLTGGTSPAADDGTNVAPVTWLLSLYANGAGSSFDAVSHHPYCFPWLGPGEYGDWCAWSQMADTPVSLRSVMTDHGDQDKKIWITEYGAPTDGARAVDEAVQAQWVTAAYEEVSKLSWAGPLFWYNHRDGGDPEDSFGLRRSDWSAKPSWFAYQDSAASTRLVMPKVGERPWTAWCSTAWCSTTRRR